MRIRSALPWTSLTLVLLACGGPDSFLTEHAQEDGAVEQELGTAYPAIADSWVRSGSSVASNKGTVNPLYLDRRDGQGAERRIFLKFEVTGTRGRAVGRARLRLFCTEGSSQGGRVHAVPNNTWEELRITWSNQPDLGVELDRAGAVAAGAWVEFDVTAQVRGDGVHGFALLTDSDDQVKYSSREAASNRPQLVVEYADSTSVPEPSPAPAPTEPPPSEPTPAPEAQPGAPTSGAGDYLVISRTALASRPTSGAAWSALLAAANASPGTPDLCNQDNRTHPQVTLAAAIVYARTGIASYLDKARAGILAAYKTQRAGCYNAVLSLGRQLGAYVLAADFIRLNDAGFGQWLRDIRDRDIGGHGRWSVLRFAAEDSSNNWGTFALASIIAADRFLGDGAAVQRDWAVFKGYGDGSWPFRPTSAYQPSWNCGRYRAIEDQACLTPGGVSKNGVPAEDASRATYPSVHAGYVNEAMQGYVLQALLLAGAGYDAWGVNASQVRRVAEFQRRFGIFNHHQTGYYAAHVLNHVYRTSYPEQPAGYGRTFGFTDWLYP